MQPRAACNLTSRGCALEFPAARRTIGPLCRRWDGAVARRHICGHTVAAAGRSAGSPSTYNSLMHMGRVITGTALLLACGLPTTGCSVVCPASGYAAIITVNVEGNAAAVDEVQLCSDQGCSERQPDHGPAVPVKSVQPTYPGATAPNHAASTTPAAAFLGTRTDADTWAFSISQRGLPAHVTVRALAVGGLCLPNRKKTLPGPGSAGLNNVAAQSPLPRSRSELVKGCSRVPLSPLLRETCGLTWASVQETALPWWVRPAAPVSV